MSRDYQQPAPVAVAEPVRTVQLPARHRPINPQFADVMVRVRSFDGKMIPSGQDVQELASAGFYHVGE